jgi:cytoskeletal protein CcmA (bactofilin family)
MKKPEKQHGISTFQGTDASIEGTIEFEGTIRMDGNFKGKIKSPAGVVIIGEQAVVEAQIDVGSAVVMGKVSGFINARNKIELFPPAKVSGDIQAPVVAVEAGVSFQGNCTMRNRVETVENAR